MNAELGQLVAIACHANAALGGRSIPPLFPDHPTCVFCAEVRFVEVRTQHSGRWTEKLIAASPDEWFRRLSERTMRGVYLRRAPQLPTQLPDWLSAGFAGGGGLWTLEVIGPDSTNAWYPRWEVGNLQAANQRGWRVTYGEGDPIDLAGSGDALAPAVARFNDALKRAELFADEHGLDTFAGRFHTARRHLAGDTSGGHAELVTEDLLAADAHAALRACETAFVFGGLGSWSDLGFGGTAQRDYEQLSSALYDALSGCLCAIVDSTVVDQLVAT